MKLRIPAGCCAVCHEGRAIEIEEDGSIDVTDDVTPVLVAHGFKLWESDGEGLGPVEAHREETLSSAANKELGEKMQANGYTKEEALAAGSTNVSDYNRKELFAFLKANGVSVSLPITNARLRALAFEVKNGRKGCADF